MYNPEEEEEQSLKELTHFHQDVYGAGNLETLGSV
jgi:hypothetical protein